MIEQTRMYLFLLNNGAKQHTYAQAQKRTYYNMTQSSTDRSSNCITEAHTYSHIVSLCFFRILLCFLLVSLLIVYKFFVFLFINIAHNNAPPLP